MASIASSWTFLPLLLVLLITVAIPAAVAGARLPMTMAAHPANLAERLDGEGSQQCWEVLMDIKSCLGEFILFFLNGEAYLGPRCCHAICVIEQSCWATDAMLSIIGFTPEEGDMLKGYCDTGDDDGGDNNGSDGRHGRPVGRLQPAPPPTPYCVLDNIGTGGSNTAAAAAVTAGWKGIVVVRHQLHA